MNTTQSDRAVHFFFNGFSNGQSVSLLMLNTDPEEYNFFEFAKVFFQEFLLFGEGNSEGFLEGFNKGNIIYLFVKVIPLLFTHL